MFVAVVTAEPVNNGNKSAPTLQYTAFGKTLLEAAGAAEANAINFRRSNPTMKFRTVVGRMTEEVEPPEQRIVLVPLNK